MLGPRLRRRLPALADQAASSISNIVVVVVVARSFDQAAFGAFSLAMLIYALVLGGIRSLVTEPFLSLYSAESAEVRARVRGDVHGSVFGVSVVCSLALTGVSAMIGGLSGAAVLALAAVLPLVMFQDAWRYVFIVDRPVVSLAIDLLWLALLVVALMTLPEGTGVGSYLVAWGLAGGVAGFFGTIVGGGWPGRPHPHRWFRRHWSVGWRFFAQFVTAQGAAQMVTAFLGAIAGLPALGAVKASSTYYGPLNSLHGGVHYAVVPEGVRSRNNPARLRRMQTMVAGGLAVVAVTWLMIGLVIPESAGMSLFGETWDDARPLMVPMGLAMVLGGGVSGALIGLRSLGDARRCLRSQLYVLPFQVVCPVAGGFLGGAEGFVYGLALARGVALMIWWRMFQASLLEVAAHPVVDAASMESEGEDTLGLAGDLAVGEVVA